MEAGPDSGGEETKPKQSQLPVSDWEYEASTPKSWIPASAGMTGGPICSAQD